jgi:hypothetical protein
MDFAKTLITEKDFCIETKQGGDYTDFQYSLLFYSIHLLNCLVCQIVERRTECHTKLQSGYALALR